MIPEDCVLTHYKTLLKSHPDLVKLTEFSKLGHIEVKQDLFIKFFNFFSVNNESRFSCYRSYH